MGTYSNLSGDTDASPSLLRRLNALARSRGEHFLITSGRRTITEQANVKSTYGPKAAATPNAPHVRGIASDVTVNGRPIWEAIPAAQLHRYGLTTFAGGETADPVHVEIQGGRSGQESTGTSAPATPTTSTMNATSTTSSDGGGPSGLLVFLVKVTAVLGGSALAILGVRRATGVGQEVSA